MGPESSRETLRDRSRSESPDYPQRQSTIVKTTCFTVFIMRFPLKRALTVICRYVIQTALKMLVTFLVFGVCLVITLRYCGIPLPSLNELLHSFDGVTQLAKILS
jgi:hypothetical protein